MKSDNLIKIQTELKAPKSQRNNFGGYNYRSAEDILEAVKPLLAKYNCQLTLADDVILVGDRIYIKATATFQDGESTITTSALARESLTKKGMDDSQITGTASSYARKYCLNGLFLIDDQKDADTDEFRKAQSRPNPKPQSKVERPEIDFSLLRDSVEAIDDMDSLREEYTRIMALKPTAGQQKIINEIINKAKERINEQRGDAQE